MPNNRENLKYINMSILIVLSIVLAYFVGMRDVVIGTDTPTYMRLYDTVSAGGETRIREYFFLFLVKVSVWFSLGANGFFYLVSFLGLIAYLNLYYKVTELFDFTTVSKRIVYVILTLSFMMMSPFFWNAEINVIRSGLAIPIFLTGLLFLYQKKYYWSVLWLFVAVMTHFSMIMFIPFLILWKVKDKWLLALFIVLSLLYLSGLTQTVFTLVSQKLKAIEFLTYYLNNAQNERGYRAGVRYDFWVFTAFFLAVIYYIRHSAPIADFLFRIYTIMIIPFLLLGYINYSDRLLLAAWNIIPMIVSIFIIKYLKTNMNTYMIGMILFIMALILSIAVTGLV